VDQGSKKKPEEGEKGEREMTVGQRLMAEKHTLTEVARKLSITPAFVNRMQRETGLFGGIGKKGRPRRFTEKDVCVIAEIMALRELDFGFKDCVLLAQTEKVSSHMLQVVVKKFRDYAEKTKRVDHIIAGMFYKADPKKYGELKPGQEWSWKVYDIRRKLLEETDKGGTKCSNTE
jgi:RecA/RadA recombinase